MRLRDEAHCGLCSIREFCEIDTPIFMFDKDGSYVVMRLEQVCDFIHVRNGTNTDGLDIVVTNVVWTGSSSSTRFCGSTGLTKFIGLACDIWKCIGIRLGYDQI